MADITKQMYTDLSLNGNVLSNAVLKNITVTAADSTLSNAISKGTLTFDTQKNIVSSNLHSYESTASGTTTYKYFGFNNNATYPATGANTQTTVLEAVKNVEQLYINTGTTYAPLLTADLTNVPVIDNISGTNYSSLSATAESGITALVYDNSANVGQPQIKRTNINLGSKIDFGDIQFELLQNNTKRDTLPTDGIPLAISFNDSISDNNTWKIATLDDSYNQTLASTARRMKFTLNILAKDSGSSQSTWDSDAKLPTAGATWKLVNDKLSGASKQGNVYLCKNFTGNTSDTTDDKIDVDGNTLNVLVLAKELPAVGTLKAIPAGTILDSSAEIWQKDEYKGMYFSIQIPTEDPWASLKDDDPLITLKGKWVAPVIDEAKNSYRVWSGDSTTVTVDKEVQTYPKAEDLLAVQGDTIQLSITTNASGSVESANFNIDKANADVVDLSSNQTIAGIKTFREINLDLANTSDNNNIIQNAVIHDGDNGTKSKGIFATSVSGINTKTSTGATESKSHSVLVTDTPNTEFDDNSKNYFTNSAVADYTYDENKASGSKLITEYALAKALDSYTGNTDIEFHNELVINSKIYSDDKDTTTSIQFESSTANGYSTYVLTLNTSDFLGGLAGTTDRTVLDGEWGKADGKGKWLLVKYADIDQILFDDEEIEYFKIPNSTNWGTFDIISKMDENITMPSKTANITTELTPKDVYAIKIKLPTSTASTKLKAIKNVRIFVHGFKTYQKLSVKSAS